MKLRYSIQIKSWKILWFNLALSFVLTKSLSFFAYSYINNYTLDFSKKKLIGCDAPHVKSLACLTRVQAFIILELAAKLGRTFTWEEIRDEFPRASFLSR